MIKSAFQLNGDVFPAIADESFQQDFINQFDILCDLNSSECIRTQASLKDSGMNESEEIVGPMNCCVFLPIAIKETCDFKNHASID